MPKKICAICNCEFQSYDDVYRDVHYSWKELKTQFAPPWNDIRWDICAYCHRLRSQYDTYLRAIPALQKSFPYLSDFAPYHIQDESDGTRLSPLKCIACNSPMYDYITPRPVSANLEQNAPQCTDDILLNFRVCLDCRDEYQEAQARAGRFFCQPEITIPGFDSELIKRILMSPDPDHHVRALMNQEGGCEQRSLAYLQKEFLAIQFGRRLFVYTEQKDICTDDTPRFTNFSGPDIHHTTYFDTSSFLHHTEKCKHGVDSYGCYYCRFKQINPRTLSSNDVHPVAHNIKKERKLLQIIRNYNLDSNSILDDFLTQNSDIKISKTFLNELIQSFEIKPQRVSRSSSSSSAALSLSQPEQHVAFDEKIKTLPKIFVHIFQFSLIKYPDSFGLYFFDYQLIRFFDKFLRKENFRHDEISITRAILYFINQRPKIKDFQRINPIWSETRYRSRLDRVDLPLYEHYFNSERFGLEFAKNYQQGEHVFCALSRLPSRPWPHFVEIKYFPVAQRLAITFVAKGAYKIPDAGKTTTKLLEEIPYITQALILYHLAEYIGSPIYIQEFVQDDMMNKITKALGSKYDATGNKKIKHGLLDYRSDMRSQHGDTILLNTPNGRNLLDLMRYLQDLSLGARAALPPFRLCHSTKDIYDEGFDHKALNGHLVFFEGNGMLINPDIPRKPLGYKADFIKKPSSR